MMRLFLRTVQRTHEAFSPHECWRQTARKIWYKALRWKKVTYWNVRRDVDWNVSLL